MTLSFYVDWNHDGNYTAENVTTDVLAAEWSLGRREPHDLMPAEGSARLTLDNGDGQFSPLQNSDVLPGRRIKIERDGTIPDFVEG